MSGEGHATWCRGCPELELPKRGTLRLCIEDPGWVMRIYRDVEKSAETGIWTPPDYRAWKMSEFKIGDEVVTVGKTWREEYRGLPGVVTGLTTRGGEPVEYCVTISNGEEKIYGESKDFELVPTAPEASDSVNPGHYTRLKALTGVETWDILDFVAGSDPDMWNLGKYWFRMGHKEGQSTLTEKRKMREYLQRSIEKEEASAE